MDVRDSVYALVERVQAGAALDDAAKDLDLGWDAHGNHATDFLSMPGVWQKLERPQLEAVIEWFLAHGADGARMLAKSVHDTAHAGAGPSPIRAYLLSRATVPDLGPALAAAFQARRLGLARTFLARGADAAAVGSWVESDLVTPKRIDVRYQALDRPQRVTLVMRLARLQPDYLAQVPDCLPVPRLLVSLGGQGILGGDLFDPKLSSVTEESVKKTEVGGDTEIRLVLSVCGVAPAGLALVFRGWVGRNLHWYPIAIELTGETELAGDNGSVDTARALSWFRDTTTDPFVPPRAVPFEVTAKPRKKVFAVIEHRDGLWRDIHLLGQALDPEILQAATVGFDADAPAFAFAHFDSKRATTKTELVLKRFGGGGAGDPAPLRAAVLHGLARLEGVTSVRWCDDAGAEALLEADGAAPAPQTPASKPAAAKAKRAKPVAVAHPDRGPSRIAALRAGLDKKALPWADMGAPAGAIPKALGDAPLPPTLREWLSGGDATWPVPRDRPLEARSFADLIGSAHPDLADVLAPLGDSLLAGPCVPLFVPSLCADGTVLFLHLPLADADGEAPIIGFDPTDEGLIGIFAPRFDHYLARVLDVDRASSTYAPGPRVDPYLEALVGRLPAKRRRQAKPHQGVIAVGALIG